MVEYIIVQAGGKGSRMEQLTVNKPKALVPINNLPMIFHLFKKFPDKKFIVIGDYKFDVLEKYLKTFAEVDYKLIRSFDVGTCSGISDALSFIPENKSFMLIWCDLILPQDYEFPEQSEKNIIGISKDFVCRWKYENGVFKEEKSSEHGVAGHFIFKNKSFLENVPEQGEFVRWLQTQKMVFDEQFLFHTHEYGLYSEWDKLPKMRCRPFNRLIVKENRVIKEGIDSQGKSLAVREVAWYKKVQDLNIENIPHIYEYNPLCMDLIDGKNIYEYGNKTVSEKKRIIKQIVDCLKTLHTTDKISSNIKSYEVAYIDKTFERLEKIRDLVPFSDKEFITVNGIECKNIFFVKEKVKKLIMQYFPDEFVLIHGDCTFSNMMLKNDTTPVLLDPRGYFGTTELYGDVAYDWAKLYYSLYSNYDQFNLKNFKLKINDENVELNIESNHWEDIEDYFFSLLSEEKIYRSQIKLILSIIWFSLTTYAWEDYDSICGAYYNGLLYLKEALNEHNV